MIVCPQCSRHHRASEASCPFCRGPVSAAMVRAFQALGGALTTFVLAACYGTGAKDYYYPYDSGPESGDTSDTGTTTPTTPTSGHTGTTTGWPTESGGSGATLTPSTGDTGRAGGSG